MASTIVFKGGNLDSNIPLLNQVLTFNGTDWVPQTPAAGATNLTFVASPTTGSLTSSTGTAATLPLATTVNSGLLDPGDQIKLNALTGTNTGDVTVTDTATIDLTIAGQVLSGIVIDASVSNAKLATMPTLTIKGNSTGATAAPQDLSVASVKTLLGYTATQIINTPAGSISAITVQSAIAELDTEKQTNILFQDEGVALGTTGTVDTINFAGVGVTAARASNVVTVTIAGGAGATNIGYTASPTIGTVTSSTGTSATLPLATIVNSGLLAPGDQVKLNALTGTNTGDVTVTDTATIDLTIAGQVLSGIVIDASVSNAKLATMPTLTLKGNNTGATAAPVDLTAASVKTLLGYTAAQIISTATGNISATDVQSAIVELEAEKHTNIQFQDEGAGLGTSGTINVINFTGSAVTTTRSTNTLTVNVPATAGVTNLGYTAAPANGTVTSSTGTSATLTISDATNAGLMTPAQFTKLGFITITQAVDLDVLETNMANMVLLSGMGANSTHYGTLFTGVTIPNNADIRTALQALETAVETKGGSVIYQDEAVALGAATVDTINFAGTGVTATRAANTVTVTIPADLVQNGLTGNGQAGTPHKLGGALTEATTIDGILTHQFRVENANGVFLEAETAAGVNISELFLTPDTTFGAYFQTKNKATPAQKMSVVLDLDSKAGITYQTGVPTEEVGFIINPGTAANTTISVKTKKSLLATAATGDVLTLLADGTLDYITPASGGVATASNGLTVATSNVKLGGTLIDAVTTVNSGTNTFVGTSTHSSGGSTSGFTFNNTLTSGVVSVGVIGNSTTTNANSAGVIGNQSQTGAGVIGISVNGNGVRAASTGTGVGLVSTSVSGTALLAQSNSGLAGNFIISPTTTNTVVDVISLDRYSGGTPANGIGAGIIFGIQASDGLKYDASRIASTFTNATFGTRTSDLQFSTVNNTVTAIKAVISGAGALKLNNYGVGTFTGTATRNLQVDAAGNVIEAVISTGSGAPLRTQQSFADIKYYALTGTPVVTYTSSAGVGTLSVTGGTIELQRIQVKTGSGGFAMDALNKYQITFPTTQSGIFFQYPLVSIYNTNGDTLPTTGTPHLIRNPGSTPVVTFVGGTAGTNLTLLTGDLTIMGVSGNIVLLF